MTSWWYFNPRTREGCDEVATLLGVTVQRISIHAPVKGATRLGEQPGRRLENFNPRTREGCDNKFMCASNAIRIFQSTHP